MEKIPSPSAEEENKKAPSKKEHSTLDKIRKPAERLIQGMVLAAGLGTATEVIRPDSLDRSAEAHAKLLGDVQDMEAERRRRSAAPPRQK